MSHRSDDTVSHKHTPRRLSGLLATRLHRHPLFWGGSINYSICVGFAPSKCYCKCCSVSVHVYMEMTYFLWCVFLQKMQHCNHRCPMVYGNHYRVFAWQTKTLYYNGLIKSPLGTDHFDLIVSGVGLRDSGKEGSHFVMTQPFCLLLCEGETTTE